MISDEQAMQMAFTASKEGFPAPNPRVGCVIVKDGRVIATGYHDHAGGPHAEIDALTKIGLGARGATVYVTLEPCNGTGRTPPCSLALIDASVARVVYAVADPNPKMAGGAERLREAGIQVDLLRMSDETKRPWLTAMERQRPFIVLKAAVSLDGRIALPSGESKWITGEESRAAGHRLRAECGAVLVGRRTVEIDNPRLTARVPGVVNQPVRIVIDLDAKLPRNLDVFNDEARTLQIVRVPDLEGQMRAPLEAGALDLHQLCRDLFAMGITGVLVEGGATTLASFVRANLADRLHLFVAPKLLGAGPVWLQDIGLKSLSESPVWEWKDSIRHGQDIEQILEPLPNK